MARRRKRLEHDNHDRWLISYADFVTLLFAFFVVMYSISSVNEEKYKTFGTALNSAFGQQAGTISPAEKSNPQEPGILLMVDPQTARLGAQQRKIQEHMKNLHAGLSQVLSELISQHQVSVNQTKRGVEIDISASTLFQTGEAALQSGSQEVLRQVALVLGKEEFPVEVEGHTDDVPIATAQFPSNWELSSARASSVVRLLIDNGVPESRLAVVGLAANQPLAPNDSQENRAKNRRVTITIVSTGLERESAKAN